MQSRAALPFVVRVNATLQYIYLYITHYIIYTYIYKEWKRKHVCITEIKRYISLRQSDHLADLASELDF